MTAAERGVYLEWGELRKFALEMAVKATAETNQILPVAEQFLVFLCGRSPGVNPKILP